jgi:hypothetical protein
MIVLYVIGKKIFEIYFVVIKVQICCFLELPLLRFILWNKREGSWNIKINIEIFIFGAGLYLTYILAAFFIFKKCKTIYFVIF